MAVMTSRNQSALTRIAEVMRARHGDRADLAKVSRHLTALVQGISVQALLDPARWPAEDVREAITSEIDVALGRPLAPA